jgi:hypothetical protein
LNIGVRQGKEAGAIGAWGTDFRIEGGGEKLSGCRAFDGKTWAIEEDLSSWGSATGEVEGTFESACPAKESTSQKDNDPCVGDDKSCVMTLPRPAGGGRADQVETEKNEPKIEPGGTVHVGTGDTGTETGFKEGGGGANSSQGEEKEHRKVKRAEGVNGFPKRGMNSPCLDPFFTRFGQRHKKRIDRSWGRTRGATLRTGYSRI